jgi:hypothetical protein
MQSEAGMMLMAEEFDFLRNKHTLRIFLALVDGPKTKAQLRKSRFGKPYRINLLLDYLVDEGKIVKVKRVIHNKFAKKHKTFNEYYIADEFLACVLSEICDLLQRSHAAYADGFKQLSGELKPLL